jgi:hypothetical protein
VGAGAGADAGAGAGAGAEVSWFAILGGMQCYFYYNQKKKSIFIVFLILKVI